MTNLEREGHVAVHVGAVLSLGVDDREIVGYARENEYVILTNDTDFLDESAVQGVPVLYFPDNRLSAYDLTTLIAEVSSYYPEQSELPGTVFLTEQNSR